MKSKHSLHNHSLTAIFSALERTFLAYLRTSLALVNLGVIVAQLFQLQSSQSPKLVKTYFDSGIPHAAACIAVATIVLILGAFRAWRQQNAMLRGKVHSGGWEIIIIVLMALTVRQSLLRNRPVC